MNRKILVPLFLLPIAAPAHAQINLAPGDVAIIGWVDNASPADVLAFVCLADIPAGTKIGFTDNGWDSATGTFRNTIGPHDGDGNEQLLLFSAVSTIPKGKIVRTIDGDPAFAWTTSGAIVGSGVTSGTYSVPNLAQGGDQVYAFQHSSGDNMLNTPTQSCLFVLDDTGAFESATTTATGDVPPGLSAAAHTALSFAQSSSGQNFMAFDTSVLASGTKSQWLAAIGNAANWTFGTGGMLPGGSIVVGNAHIGTVTCAGDGSGTACPCGNVSPSGAGEGCATSFGLGGTLRASGIPSLSSDTVVLAGAQMPNSTCLYFQGTSQAAGGSGTAFGDGLRCATGSMARLGTKINALGGSQYPAAGDPHVSAKGAISSPATRTYQVWFRNAASFCTSSTFNLTNGLSIAWGA